MIRIIKFKKTVFLCCLFTIMIFLCKLNKSRVHNVNLYKEDIRMYGKIINQHEVTVVSSYFLLKKSKHNSEKYNNWIRNFFTSVTAPLVIFTDNKSIDNDLLKLRENFTTILYVYESHWDILKEIELKRNKNYSFNYKSIQNDIDPEKRIHNPDLYVLWNMKSFITNKIAKENPFNSLIFIYTDSGAWRQKTLLNWPNIPFIKTVSNIIKDKILFGQISKTNSDKSSSFPEIELIEGGFYLGTKKAINKFETNFWQIHDERFDKGLFIGKDQTMMNIISSIKSNEIVRLQTWNLNCKNAID